MRDNYILYNYYVDCMLFTSIKILGGKNVK